MTSVTPQPRMVRSHFAAINVQGTALNPAGSRWYPCEAIKRPINVDFLLISSIKDAKVE